MLTAKNSAVLYFLPFRDYLKKNSKTPYVAIDERGLVRSIHLLFFFLCELVK